MFQTLFLILFVSKLEVLDTSDVSKIIKAHIRRDDWKLLEKEQQNDGLDLFSKQKAKDDYYSWDVIFKARSSTVEILKNHSIQHYILVDNIESILKTGEEETLRRSNVPSNQITFTEYVTYEEILSYLESLSNHSNIRKNISVESIGRTTENRDIMMVKVQHQDAKYTMFVDAGIHAREWLSIMQGLFLIEQIVCVGNDSNLSRMNWYIIPCLNPDGYVYSHTKNHRLQRKNMNKQHCPSSCQTCGVDLNRNFGYKFGVSGTSTNPCSEIYRGEYAFSEPESRALRDVLQKYYKQIKLYLTVHSFGRLFLYPWGYASKNCDDWYDLRIAAVVARDAIHNHSKIDTIYEVKNTGSDFYPAAGGSDDYAKHLGIKYSYTMELQGGGSSGFNPPTSRIKEYVKENFAGIAAMAEYIHKPYNYKETGLSNKSNIFICRTMPGNVYVVLYTLFWGFRINQT